MRITIIHYKIFTTVRAASISVLLGAWMVCSSALGETTNIYVRNNTDPFQAPYYIFSSTSGGASETVTLEKGSTYKFISTNTAGHPFNVGAGWRVADSELVTSSDSSSSVVSGVGSISTGQTLTVTVPASFSKSTITYYCSAHSTMVSTLAVVEGDSQAPVITLQGDNPQEVELGSSYVEAGASADTGETVVIDSSEVDTGTVGSYSVTYDAVDSAGNVASTVTRIVNVVSLASSDATAPIITLLGDNPQTVEAGTSYVEAGATADTGETVVIDSSSVDTGTVGSYTVTYSVTDAAGNSADPVLRTVNVINSSFIDSDDDGYSDSDEVEWGSDPLDQSDAPIEALNWSLFANVGKTSSVDSSAPVISLTGANPQTVQLGSTYLELGATTDTGETVVIDASDVDTTSLGSYTVTYNSSDAAGNKSATVSRIVNVIAGDDSAAPVITLNGSNPQTGQLGSQYVEAGATTDTGESVAIDASGVNTSVAGSYSVTYNATDAAGNAAPTVTRIVNVIESGGGIDTSAPVITLNGLNPHTVQIDTAYEEAGATADSGETVEIDSSQVNTSEVGSYVVTYTAKDAAGNSAIPVTRTVNVIDSSSVNSKVSALVSIVDNIVIPNVQSLATAASEFAEEDGVLQDYGDSLVPASTGGGYYKTEADSLLAARNGWKQLMQVVQANDMHILGPAARNKQDLRNRIHGYYLGGPSLDSFDEFSSCGTDVLVVKANDGSREVADSNINTRGMIALEYLLFNEDLSHSCGSGVSAVAGWNALSDAARKSQRYDLALKIAQDIALNAGKIQDEWSSYRTEFIDPDEAGTNFQLLTDSLFYFEKYTKSAKLAAVIGQDRLCVEDLCAKFIESHYSETSLSNIKVNAEQFLSIFDSGLDNLADESDSGFSSLFKGLITDVVTRITELEASADPMSLKAHVSSIEANGAINACGNAFANPDSEVDPQICALAGKMKKVTDKLKIEFVTYLGVSLPEAAQGDTD